MSPLCHTLLFSIPHKMLSVAFYLNFYYSFTTAWKLKYEVEILAVFAAGFGVA